MASRKGPHDLKSFKLTSPVKANLKHNCVGGWLTVKNTRQVKKINFKLHTLGHKALLRNPLGRRVLEKKG